MQYDLFILPPRPVVSRPLSLTTARNYRCRVRAFLASMPVTASVADLTRQSIQRHIRTLSAVNSLRMRYAAISHFCNWLISEGWLRENPAKGITLPKAQHRRREPVPENAVSLLLEACSKLPASLYKQALARATLSLLVYGGLRRGECVALELGDFDTSTGEVIIRSGKGGKERRIYVCRECTDAVRALIDLRPLDCTHEYLLAQNKRQGVGYTGLRAILRRLHVVAGLKEHYTPHQLRHSCATRLVANGATLPDVQEFLGHANLSTTGIYVHSSKERLQNIAHLASLSVMPAPPQNTQNTQNTQKQPAFSERRRVAVRRLR
jgi:site-specific recombinase XerD